MGYVLEDDLVLASHFEHISFQHIKSQGNQAAHHIAKIHSQALPLVYSGSFPASVVVLACNDNFKKKKSDNQNAIQEMMNNQE